MITLNAKAHSDLNWESELERAKNQEGPLYWVFDFGHILRPHDALFFSSCSLAVEEFTKKIWPQVREQTVGAVLFDGDCRFSSRIVECDKTQQLFEEFAAEYSADFDLETLYQLFSANVLSEFFHRLASALPEEVKAICRIHAEDETDRAFVAQMLCKRRFEHLNLEITGAPWLQSRSRTAVSLPLDEKLHPQARAQINALLNEDVRIIPEELLNEEWEGVDRILALRSYTSEWGMRMMQGFEAAGGEVEFL